MDAQLVRCAVLAAAVASLGASYRTNNFVVSAPTQEMAEQIGRTAEKYRRELAVEWLGKEMPKWSQPCPITAQVGDHLGAGGATSFVFEHGEVFGWRMTIQGSMVRILDSVLPHEVTHTIFATHFRQPLPRWADEGACTTVEHSSERSKQQTMLIEFLRTNRGIAFARMFTMKDYPHDVLPLYSQGYSVARYLVAQGGKKKFLDFVADGLQDENWSRAVQKHYGYEGLGSLQNTWLAWVKKGSPALEQAPEGTALVAVKSPAPSDVAETDQSARGKKFNAPLPGPDNSALASNTSGSGPSVYELAATQADSFKPAPAKTGSAWHAPRGSKPAANEEAPAQAAAVPQQVTRPQPIERPRQVILEWNRPPGEQFGAEATASRAAPSAN